VNTTNSNRPSHIKDRLERYLVWYAHYVKADELRHGRRLLRALIESTGGCPQVSGGNLSWYAMYDFLNWSSLRSTAWLLVAIAADAIQIGACRFCPGRFGPRRNALLDAGCSRRSIRLLGWHWAFLAHVGGRTDSWVRSFPTWTACRVLCDPPASSPWGPEILPPGPDASSAAVTPRVFFADPPQTNARTRLSPGASVEQLSPEKAVPKTIWRSKVSGIVLSE